MGIGRKAEGAEIIRLQFGRALEQFGRPRVQSLSPRAAAGEEVRLERIRRQAHGAVERVARLHAASGGEQGEAHGRVGIGEVGLERERLCAMSEDVLE